MSGKQKVDTAKIKIASNREVCTTGGKRNSEGNKMGK